MAAKTFGKSASDWRWVDSHTDTTGKKIMYNRAHDEKERWFWCGLKQWRGEHQGTAGSVNIILLNLGDRECCTGKFYPENCTQSQASSQSNIRGCNEACGYICQVKNNGRDGSSYLILSYLILSYLLTVHVLRYDFAYETSG